VADENQLKLIGLELEPRDPGSETVLKPVEEGGFQRRRELRLPQ
jgi:hypothetical protein